MQGGSRSFESIAIPVNSWLTSKLLANKVRPARAFVPRARSSPISASPPLHDGTPNGLPGRVGSARAVDRHARTDADARTYRAADVRIGGKCELARIRARFASPRRSRAQHPRLCDAFVVGRLALRLRIACVRRSRERRLRVALLWSYALVGVADITGFAVFSGERQPLAHVTIARVVWGRRSINSARRSTR